MVVQHNLTAMNSNRMLGLTTKTQAKSTEKLSSGYKINRAADDAAGLSISEKMRKQIRGLTQASNNAQDGISTVQTAEGALNEVQDMLQRMNELAVKAANGTNSEDDRSYIQNEIDQLTTEIDRVAETTKFNETYLLKGDKSKKDYAFNYKADTTSAAGAVTMDATAGNNSGATVTIAFKAIDADGDAAMKAAQNELGALLKKDGISVTGTTKQGGGFDTSFSLSSDKFIVEGTTIKDKASGKAIADITGTATKAGTDTIKATAFTEATSKGDKAQYYDKDGNKIPENALSNYMSYDGTNITENTEKTLYDAAGEKVGFNAAKFDKSELTGSLTLTLHVGADATTNNQISVSLDAMSAKGLGVNGLKVDGADDTNALNAIDTVKEAIQKVSTQRSALGAVQNRLEHTINNLDNVVENTTSAESQIRDTDMATEMVKYSNNNILAQAGQAMLAQSNQANQGVLSLLQ